MQFTRLGAPQHQIATEITHRLDLTRRQVVIKGDVEPSIGNGKRESLFAGENLAHAASKQDLIDTTVSQNKFC